MKKFITLCSLLIILFFSFIYHNKIVDLITNIFSSSLKKSSSTIKNNDYATNTNFKYVKLTQDFKPKNKDDIKDIYYTIINSGMSDFTFYCDKKYKSCLDDVNFISNNQQMLSYLNNFVSVYNSFKNIETEFDSLGKVKIHITHNYNNSQIEEINNKIKEIIDSNITVDMNDEQKIKAIHDYIINNAKYDTNKSDNKINKYHSDIAYGALIEGYAICGGYADSMKLFLDYFNIPNFKISSENHIWNVIKLNDKWLHLDVTWDDPVTSNGEDILDYSYFLIDTKELLEYENEQHGFDFNVYQELKED